MQDTYNGYIIKIEENVPIPAKELNPTLAMKDLKVGGSIFYPGLVRNNMTSRATQIRQQKNFRFYRFHAEDTEEVVTKVDGTKEKAKGTRVWRLPDYTQEELDKLNKNK